MVAKTKKGMADVPRSDIGTQPKQKTGRSRSLLCPHDRCPAGLLIMNPFCSVHKASQDSQDSLPATPCRPLQRSRPTRGSGYEGCPPRDL